MTEHATLADCLVVVPMKDPACAKTRLSDALSAFDRQSLAWHLYRGTLDVLRSVQRHTHIDLAVVTGNRDISNHGAEAGIAVISEGPEASLTGAVQSAAAWASAQGYARLCVLPADLAAPKASDIVRLLECDARAVVVPATDMGTNGLLVSPPMAMPFCYGPRSAIKHMQCAEEIGLDPILLPLESLRIDIDTSDCLERVS